MMVCLKIITALPVHKAVKVEKPAGIHTEEVKQMVSTANEEHVLFMETMKERFTLACKKIKKLVLESMICDIIFQSRRCLSCTERKISEFLLFKIFANTAD